MRYLYGKYGCTSPLIKEYKISTQTDLSKGTVMAVCQNDSLEPIGENTKMVAGILATDYEVNENILNPNSASGRAKINLSEGVYAMRAPVFSCTGGTETTVVVSNKALAGVAPAEIVGGKLVLKSKSHDSTNTDELLCERTITAFSVSGDACTFTVSEGSAPSQEDEYIFYPAISFSSIGFTGDVQNLGVCKNGIARVIANDEKNEECHIVFTAALCA